MALLLTLIPFVRLGEHGNNGGTQGRRGFGFSRRCYVSHVVFKPGFFAMSTFRSNASLLFLRVNSNVQPKFDIPLWPFFGPNSQMLQHRSFYIAKISMFDVFSNDLLRMGIHMNPLTTHSAHSERDLSAYDVGRWTWSPTTKHYKCMSDDIVAESSTSSKIRQQVIVRNFQNVEKHSKCFMIVVGVCHLVCGVSCLVVKSELQSRLKNSFHSYEVIFIIIASRSSQGQL
ncbi:hypothetical protein HELRODRAFT_165485 [Helobdella robusta]|uniref:Uncharacterized protein n=1 Tax=Helobdella robusta TaxID=6412 RepID=T1EWW1_HELRO|nr:hypothetical protein HELRODRAFT_165485 [Helobdella robusta]ESN91449.1 hypothetical protein HELRODRAFT_165485 [Helobdella robusta]